MKFNLVIVIGIMAISSGCATPYKSVGLSGGYSETQIAENAFKVSFQGNGYTRPERAADLALLRSAYLTLENGFKYFVIIDNSEYSNVSTYITPRTTTTNLTFLNNTAYANSNTIGGLPLLIRKPNANIVIVCFNEKPDYPGLVYEATYVQNSIKSKYGLN